MAVPGVTRRSLGGLRPARVSRSRGWWTWLWLCLWWALAAFMLLPVALGWQDTALSRHQVVDWARGITTGSRIQEKFMYQGDLPHVVSFTNSDQRAWTPGGYWVVASSSPNLAYGCNVSPCAKPPVWSIAYLSDAALPLPVSAPSVVGFDSGVIGRPAWPAFFDRLPDRAAPDWWPLVPSRVVAVPLAMLSLSLGIVVMVRSRWQRRPMTGAGER